jgi:exopolysaccharide biosynthesis polyprenyl glycosylphosphotransferase
MTGKQESQRILTYIFADVLAAGLAWTVLYVFRKRIPESLKFGFPVEIEFDKNYYYGLILVPAFWVLLYASAGFYSRILRRHRLKELSQTLFISIIGAIILFFVLILDDQIASYKNYYQSLVVLFSAHFGFTFAFRFFLTNSTVKQVQAGKIGFKTLIVGGNDVALQAYNEIINLKKSPGFLFVGFVQVNGSDKQLESEISCLGKYHALPELIRKNGIEEVIIAIDSSDHRELGSILNTLEGTGVIVKVIPDMYDILAGSVKMSSIFGTPLIEINNEIMPAWQFSIKRIMDMLVSALAILLLLPIYLVIAMAIKISSKGPIFFLQQRVGLHGKPFTIYKFRSMHKNAELAGPQLSSKNDARVTKVGRFLRKTRLDELPQFWNVLKGDMALVGPRPERKYYIDLIMKQAPHYRHLHKVRPGITSWGQVKYGYAENVEQMIQRLKYDVLYIENMSIAVDIKILFYTVLIVLKGSGK